MQIKRCDKCRFYAKPETNGLIALVIQGRCRRVETRESLVTIVDVSEPRNESVAMLVAPDFYCKMFEHVASRKHPGQGPRDATHKGDPSAHDIHDDWIV